MVAAYALLTIFVTMLLDTQTTQKSYKGKYISSFKKGGFV